MSEEAHDRIAALADEYNLDADKLRRALSGVDHEGLLEAIRDQCTRQLAAEIVDEYRRASNADESPLANMTEEDAQRAVEQIRRTVREIRSDPEESP